MTNTNTSIRGFYKQAGLDWFYNAGEEEERDDDMVCLCRQGDMVGYQPQEIWGSTDN